MEGNTGSPGGRRVSLHKSPKPHLIIDFDRPSFSLDRNRFLCDYLFIDERQEYEGYVVLIGLNKGDLHTREVHRQLTEHSAVSERSVPSEEAIRFRLYQHIEYGFCGDKEAKMSEVQDLWS